MPQLDGKDSEVKKACAFAAAGQTCDLQSVTRILADAASIDREYLARGRNFKSALA